MLIGCSGDDTHVPDPDASGGGTGGLVVQWASTPESWPGDVDNGATIERASFALDSLRVVGDAGPGDPRTTASGFMVRWDENTVPSAVMFADAPSGLYSQISMAIDGHTTTETFELRGHVNIDGTDYEYGIDGDAPLTATIQIEEMLTPPATATVRLRIDFKKALGSLDFKTLPVDGGRIELDDSDPEMVDFRKKLVESFTVTTDGAVR